MAILQNFPTDQPALSLDFARSQRLDPRISFSRSTSRTYFNEDGLLVSAAANTPRFSYAFPQSKNLLRRTDYLSTWDKISTGGGSVTVTDHNSGAPDGTSTATLVTVVAGGTGAESIYLDQPIRGNGTYSSSVFVKAGTQTAGINLAAFYLYDTQQGFSFSFNPTTGLITGTGGGSNHTVVPYPNGWYRIYFTTSGSAYANDILRFQIYFQTSGTVSLWGPQLEEGSVVTDYVSNSVDQSREPKSQGLILEPSSTNFSVYSQNFQDTYAGGSGGSGTKYLNSSPVMTANAGTAPDGTNTATRMQVTASSGRVTTIVTAGAGVTKNQQVCFSVFAKANQTSKIRLDLVCNCNTTDYSYRGVAEFDLVGNGSYLVTTISPSADGQVSSFCYGTIEPLYNGWYRCSVSFRTYNGTGTLNATLGEIRFNGTAEDILIWGDQFEDKAYPTSYIATNGSTVTSTSDLASIVGRGFTNTYNKFEGTFFAEFTPKGTLGPDIYGGVFGVSSQTNPAPFNFLFVNPFNSYAMYVATRNQTINSISGISVNVNNRLSKIAGSYSADSYDFSLNGTVGTPSINANALVHDFDCYILGRNFYTADTWGNVVLSKVMYYPKKLNSLQLRELTK